jgi:ParB family transcriptional regulator, chromosome partitioning protein
MPSVIQSIPLNQIQPSKHQARKEFDEEKLNGLAESMRTQGLMNPIVVRPTSSAERGTGSAEVGSLNKENLLPRSALPAPRFELISGERRVRAAKLLGWTEIEAKIIATSSEAEAAVKGLVENIQREDLNPIEEAEGFQELQQLDPKVWSQDKIAETVGKRKDYVSRSFGLLELPQAVLEKLRQRNLSREHGVELMRLSGAISQKHFATDIEKKQWTVKETRIAIDQFLQGSAPQQHKAPSQEPTEPELIDPVADIWDPIKAKTKGWLWAESYSAEKTWDFSINLTQMTNVPLKKALGQWFLAMAEAFGETKLDHHSEKMVDVTNAVSDAYIDVLKKIQTGEIKSPSGKSWAELEEKK